MRIFSAKAAARLDEPKLSIAPLIDICFLLLIYFMVTTTIKPAEMDVQKQVPGRGAISTTPVVSVMVHVQKSGSIVVNPGPDEIYMSTDPNQRKLPLLEEYLRMLRPIRFCCFKDSQRESSSTAYSKSASGN